MTSADTDLTTAQQQLHHPVVVEKAAERAADLQLRVADAITAFAGSMPFVYIHGAVFAVWMLFLERSPWPTLTLVVSLEAIFLSTFVMIGHNRQAAFQQRLKVDAVSVGFNAQPGSMVALHNSSVHAVEAVHGTVTLLGTNDLSLPPLNLLGASGRRLSRARLPSPEPPPRAFVSNGARPQGAITATCLRW